MKKILSWLIILIIFSACSFSQLYLYRPTPFERAVKRATSTTESGERTLTQVTINDLDVREWSEDIWNAWRKRDQIARGLEVSGATATEGLGVISTVLSYLSVLPGFNAIIGAIATLAGKATSAINASGRTEAYADGTEMLGAAMSEFDAGSSGRITTDGLSDTGKNLLRRANCAIGVVEAAISGKATDKSKCN